MVSLRAMASSVPPAPAAEEVIVDCVTFFSRGGERRRGISKEKHKLRCKIERQERSLQKLKNPVGGYSREFWMELSRKQEMIKFVNYMECV